MKPQPKFAAETADHEKFKRLLRKPAPTQRYVMHFTPRSGSSWLTDLCKLTGRLSEPGEYFNPQFVPKISTAINARTLPEFVQGITRRRNAGGVFGCQITIYQLHVTFSTEEMFDQLLGGARMFWLIREDIVLQAVSLLKMQQTKIAHRPTADEATVLASESQFSYDAQALRRWLEHLHRAEIASEALFAKFGYQPLRLSYEQLTALPILDVVNIIATHVGVEPIAEMPGESSHSKIGTDRNQAFADQFRKENEKLLAKIEAKRAKRLSLINRTPPLIRGTDVRV